MEAMMEEAIEQAYIEEGLDVSSLCFYLYGHVSRLSVGPQRIGASNACLGFVYLYALT